MSNFFDGNINIKNLTPDDFSGKRITHSAFKNKPGFVIFYAPWCPYCADAKPEFISIAEKVNSGIAIGAVDCAKYPNLAKNLGITAYPTFKYVLNGNIQSKMESTENMLNFLCKEVNDSFYKIKSPKK